MKIQLIKPRKRWLALGVMSLMVLFISATTFIGCAAEEEEVVVSTVNSAADIAQTSDADYDNNENGLITITTLKSWIDDWATNKPADVTGNLVIITTGAGETPREYLDDTNTGVYSYLAASTDYAMDRSSGPITTRSMVSDGAGADAFLTKFAIDPTADMVVVVMGTGSNFGNMTIGRVWYMLRYWGMAKENLAILNGGLDYWTDANGGIDDTYFMDTVTEAPANGTASVKSLTADNTALQISLGELIDWVDGTTTPENGYVIWDVRTSSEYDGSKIKGGSIFEGHIKGAVHFGYAALLDSTTGYSYKDKATLATLIGNDAPTADTVETADTTGIGYSAANGTAGKIIVSHCKTSWRAMVSAIASGVVLGYPHRLYDGAWAEWGDLSNSVDANGDTGLAADSIWLTDTAARSTDVTYPTGSTDDGEGNLVSDNTGEIPSAFNDTAANATAIIDADKAYKE